MRIRARLLSASLVVVSACGALEISTLSQDMLTSGDNPYNFGSSLTIGTPYTHTFTVSETDPTTTTTISGVTAVTACTHFSINAGSGSACGGMGAGCDAYVLTTCPHDYNFDVTFTPAFPGTDTCEVMVNGSNGSGSDDYTMMLYGTGSGSAYAMTVAPSTIPFGQQPIMTTSAPGTVTVTNTGSGTLDITTTLVQGGTSGSAFQQVSGMFGSSHPLGSGSSENYQVDCDPPMAVSYSGLVQVTASEGGLMGSSALSCTGIVSSFLVNPTPADFGTTLVGVKPANVMLTLSDTVPTSLSLPPTLDSAAIAAGVTVAGMFNTNGFGGGSGNASVTLAWNASAPATGSLGTLTLTTPTDNRVVQITGIAQPAGIGTNPSAVDLGPICIGGSASAMLDVYANDVGNVTLGGAGVMGTMFTLNTGTVTFPYMLGGNHNGDAMMTVSAAPMAGAQVGDATGKVVLSTNLPPTPPTEVDIAVHATVLAGGLGASPTSLAFGTVPLLKTSSPKTATVANCSGATLNITNTQITGPNASDFILVSPDSGHLTGMLANTMSQQYSIVMLPQTKGQKVAELEIAYGAGSSFMIPLSGNGGSETTSKDRETYYACSAGGGGACGALWPIAVAGAWLARRRRRR